MWFNLDCPCISTPHKSTIFWGLHEIHERQLVQQFLPSALPVVELGGGLGVVACHINRKLANPSAHIVVEANPLMIQVLTTNREVNQCKFQIVHAALGYGSNEILLGIDDEFVATAVGETGTSKQAMVQTISLRELLDQFGIKKCAVVCDIEGAEIALIENEADIITSHVDLLIVELHPATTGWRDCRRFVSRMLDIGFILGARAGNNLMFHR
jgi:FkbM family methyltransferase